MTGYLKFTPARELMAPHLESLRSLEIRANAVKREYGEDNHEYKRLWALVKMGWNDLNQTDRGTYMKYMQVDHSAPLPEVPEEGENERSI